MVSNLGSLLGTIVVLGVTVALLRSFNGKEYEYDSAHNTKAKATKRARELKDMDFKTRVTSESQNGSTVHVVYKRDDNGSGFFY